MWFLLLILSFNINSFFPTASLNQTNTTAITAHRGYHTHVPENTIAAVEAAITIKADYVEIDIQETKDGVLVACHDSNLKRLTSYNVNLWDVNYKDLSCYPLISSSTSNHLVFTIPTLKDILTTANGKIKLNIEVKYTGYEKNIIPTLLNLITEHHMENYCLISSFHKPFLHHIKALNPSLKVGYIIDSIPKNVINENVDIISLSLPCVNRAVVQEIKNSGKEIHVWTVNNESDILRMLNLKVNNIITDNPSTAIIKKQLKNGAR